MATINHHGYSMQMTCHIMWFGDLCGFSMHASIDIAWKVTYTARISKGIIVEIDGRRGAGMSIWSVERGFMCLQKFVSRALL